MDKSPRASPSPERTVFPQGLLSRSKKVMNGPDDSTNALSVDTSGSNERGGLRASVDRGLDRLRDKTRTSSDTDRASSMDSGRKMSRLVPRRSKRRKKDISMDKKQSTDNPSPAPFKNSNNSKLNIQSGNASTESFNDKSGGSSLLTEDSDSDINPTKPPLVSRPSHADYLTFTSPLISAATVDSSKQPALAPRSPSPLRVSQPTSPLSKPPELSEPSSPAQSSLQVDRSATEPSESLRSSGSSIVDPTLPRVNTIPRKEVARNRPASSRSPRPPIPPLATSPTDSERPSTPSTYITPPTPVLRQESPNSRASKRASISLGTDPAEENPALARKPIQSPRNPNAARRPRSGTSASTGSILFPQPEEVKTPGGTLITPSGSSGFFSSVFSATQNAVNQISSLANPSVSGQRSRSGTASSRGEGQGSTGGEEVIVPGRGKGGRSADHTDDIPEPALKTIGRGNLSLSHLGIANPFLENTSMATRTESVETNIRSRSSTQNNKGNEEASAAEAVSAAYSQPGSEKSVPLTNDGSSVRPRSITSTAGAGPGDITPPRSVTNDQDAASLIRSGSVRSRLSGRNKRSRNSSGATGGAIAAALSASHTALANPAASDRKPTGFAVASSKRNKEFHQTFRSVPEDDYLVEDYSAALQRDILLQGRLYVSEKHVCFSSNILGWVTNLVISFDEVVAMEKKSTAMIFPNAVVVQTLHSKHVFASFISRDQTYDMLVSIWRVGHNLKTSELGHAIDESTTDEKVELADSPESGIDSGEESDDGSDEAGLDQEDGVSDAGVRPASVTGSDAGDTVRMVSARVAQPTMPSGTVPNGVANKLPESSTPPGGATANDFPGPATHVPSECTDKESHFDKGMLDASFPAPLGKIYSLLFGPMFAPTMRKFLVDDQKCFDLQLEDDKKGLGEDTKTNSYSYVKPLNASIGPKQTKCIVTQTLDAFDLERSVSVTCTTQNPDVPSGNVFVVKTRYCLMWGPANTTRVIGNATVEWSGKSWIKGPIEKGCADGQAQHGKDLTAFLKAQLASRSPTKAPRGKVKSKKPKTTHDVSKPAAGVGAAAGAASSGDQGRGPLEPLRGILGPAGSLLSPLMTTTGVMALLLLFVTSMWIRSSRRAVPGEDDVAFSGLATPQRLAAYDQLWRREETQLWDWLEDRLNLNGLSPESVSGMNEQQKIVRKSSSEDGSAKELKKRMDERQVDDAIRVTEERLKALKESMGKPSK